ncbi:MAG: nucleotidyltransferase domain-containing protein, partial [Candidatus Peribacteraceae bacterium]|nr:nucleotidyltransferase domain-containing protein [Candidatus Peribacteraceae bacterium]
MTNFLDPLGERLILCRMLYGSHLYGTDTEESDKDYKGVFLPLPEDLLLENTPKSFNLGNNRDKKEGEKNTKDDVDMELYSLAYFVKLAMAGETVALDMLHAPDTMIIEKHPIWDFIIENRDKFYTKDLKAFVGYARKQAGKYGVKGSRLNDAKMVLDFCDLITSVNPDIRLSEVWDGLPDGEHIIKHTEPDKNGIMMYEVCQRKTMETSKIRYLRDTVNKFYENYGNRAKMAARSEGVDWKAISHAFRAGYQVKELLSTGNIIFPLTEANFLLRVKIGDFHYKNDEIGEKLDALMDEIEELTKESTFPMKPDVKFWELFLMSVHKHYLCTGSLEGWE